MEGASPPEIMVVPPHYQSGQLHASELTEPENTFATRIRSWDPDPSKFAEMMDVGSPLYDFFAKIPPIRHLHVIVQSPHHGKYSDTLKMCYINVLYASIVLHACHLSLPISLTPLYSFTMRFSMPPQFSLFHGLRLATSSNLSTSICPSAHP